MTSLFDKFTDPVRFDAYPASKHLPRPTRPVEDWPVEDWPVEDWPVEE
jgi:hypothetical protein